MIRSMWMRSRGPAAVSPLPRPIRAAVLLDRIHCSHIRAVSGSNAATGSPFNLSTIALDLSRPGCPRRSCQSCLVEIFGLRSASSNSSSTPSNSGVDVVIALCRHVSPRNSNSPRSRSFAIFSSMPFARCICPPVGSKVTRAPSSVSELVDNRLILSFLTYNTFWR